MIDGLFKRYIDPLWEVPARPLARVFTANQVTLIGLGLVTLVSLAYVWHRAPGWYAVTLALAFSADSLDGAVARLRRESSSFGGYLDAVVDRYQELIAIVPDDGRRIVLTQPPGRRTAGQAAKHKRCKGNRQLPRQWKLPDQKEWQEGSGRAEGPGCGGGETQPEADGHCRGRIAQVLGCGFQGILLRREGPAPRLAYRKFRTMKTGAAARRM